jgi:hypothetical protein
MQEMVIGRKITVLGWPQAKVQDTIEKITKAKIARGMAQVQHLPTK